MKKYKVKLFSSTATVQADYYIIEHGGTLTFKRDGESYLSFNHRNWSEIAEVVDG